MWRYSLLITGSAVRVRPREPYSARVCGRSVLTAVVPLLAACLLSAAPARASEPIGCILPIYCGDPSLPPCSIECAPLAEFSWFRYCPGHLSDGYVWHPVLGGAYAYRLRQEENGDLTFVTTSDELPADGVEDVQCGPWGQRG